LRKPSPTITDWKLTVVGYTINISGDKYNLDLSAPVRRQ
jgi:outer membrane protein OmpA-like peptidoglycan-associated protein